MTCRVCTEKQRVNFNSRVSEEGLPCDGKAMAELMKSLLSLFEALNVAVGSSFHLSEYE